MQYGAYGVEVARRLNVDDAPMRGDSCQGLHGRLFYLVASRFARDFPTVSRLCIRRIGKPLTDPLKARRAVEEIVGASNTVCDRQGTLRTRPTRGILQSGETTVRIVLSASVTWTGGTKDGVGAVSTQSRALYGHPCGFGSRFEAIQRHQTRGANRCGARKLLYEGLAMMPANSNHAAGKASNQTACHPGERLRWVRDQVRRFAASGQVTGRDLEELTVIANQSKAGCPDTNTDVVLEVTVA